MGPDWDRRYREDLYCDSPEPHDLVVRFVRAFPLQRPVIDIAMGQGRDATFVARAGYSVVGLERSIEAIKLVHRRSGRDGEIVSVLGDALNLPFKEGIAGGVLVFNFLERRIFGELIQLLVPGGVLLYETFLKRQTSEGAIGPKNPDYLLGDGELYERLRYLDLLFYEERIVGSGEKRRAVARYAGRKK